MFCSPSVKARQKRERQEVQETAGPGLLVQSDALAPAGMDSVWPR